MSEHPSIKPTRVVIEEPLTDEEIAEKAAKLCGLMTEIEKEEDDLKEVKDAAKDRIGRLTKRLETLRHEIETKRAEKEVDAFEKEASRQRHFKILSDVTGAMAAGQNDPSAVLEVATRELADAIGDACVVSLVDDRREHLVPTVFHHRDPKGEEVLREVYLKASARVGQGLAGEGREPPC